MTGKAMSTLRGLGIGLAVGGATALMGNGMMGTTSKRKMRKSANKALKTMSDLVDSAQSMIK